MSARQTVTLVLLVLVVIGTGWFLNRQDSSRQSPEVSATVHDSFVHGMDLRAMDASGRVQYHVRAASMLHFPHLEHLELDRPEIELRRRDGTVWHITSDRGQATDSGDRIWLLGEVDIRRPASADAHPLRVRTSDLLVKPEQEVAETDQPARILAERYRIHATGMKADFRNNQLQLRSKVRTTFDGAG